MTTKKIKVVCSGSGIRYPVHAGALKAILERGHEIEAICGVSGGAIVSACVATGYSPTEDIEDIIMSIIPSETKMLDPSIKAPFTWGIYNGDRLERTFEILFPKTFSDTLIPLYVGTVNLNRWEHKVFSSTETPDMSIAKAVRASMGIPGVFKPVKIEGDLHVDGGVMANFPLSIFGTGEDVLGLRVMTNQQAEEAHEIDNIFQYGSAILRSMMAASSKEHIEQAIFARTIPLLSDTPTGNLKANKEAMQAMFDSGYRQATEWLLREEQKKR